MTQHPSIKFTANNSSEAVEFLDVKVIRSEDRLITDLLIKPTDTHQYLHASSSHVYHVKRSIPYSQALRLNRICSEPRFFDHRCNQIEDWFNKSYAKLPKLNQGSGESKRCGWKRCGVCLFIKSSKNFSDKEGCVYQIKSEVTNCNTSHIVYLITCKTCRIQCVPTSLKLASTHISLRKTIREWRIGRSHLLIMLMICPPFYAVKYSGNTN